MCGIVLAAGDISQDQEKAFKMMLVLDVFRGEDSTGVASVAKYQGAEVRVAKALGHPFNLFETRPYERAMAQSHRVLIGHNRFATSGGISRLSAHPFEFDGLVGVHNGTLTNKWELPDANDFKVDSENLYHYINQAGADEAIANTAGAWALVWWDKRDTRLNIIRNKERPLWLTYSEDGKCLFGASESWMLYAALGRNGIKFEEPFQIKEDMLHTWTIEQGGKLGKPHVRELKGKPTVVTSFTGRGAPTTTPGTAKTVQQQQTKKESKILTLPRPKKTTASASDNLLPPSATYMSRNGVLYMKVGDNVDGYGAPYIELIDPEETAYQVRLYVHAQHGMETKPVGTTFRGNVSGYTSHEGGYYKISPWSICDVEVPSEQEHRDHKGHMVTAKQWEDTYGVCAFCNDFVPASDSAYVILTTQGQCLCKGCSNDSETAELVTPANTFIH